MRLPKNDFTNVLVPKGKKQVPVTIKAIFRNMAHLFKAPVSRGKKMIQTRNDSILFLKIFTENRSGTHLFG